MHILQILKSTVKTIAVQIMFPVSVENQIKWDKIHYNLLNTATKPTLITKNIKTKTMWHNQLNCAI